MSFWSARRAALASYKLSEPRPEPWASPPDQPGDDAPEPVAAPAPPSADAPPAPDQALITELRARIAELEAERRGLVNERETDGQLITALRAEVEQYAARVAELEAERGGLIEERETDGQLIAALRAEVEQQAARVAELEAAADAPAGDELFAAVMRLPGLERLLLDKYHPDKHPKDRDDDVKWRMWNEATRTINAAFEALKRRAA